MWITRNVIATIIPFSNENPMGNETGMASFKHPQQEHHSRMLQQDPAEKKTKNGMKKTRWKLLISIFLSFGS